MTATSADPIIRPTSVNVAAWLMSIPLAVVFTEAVWKDLGGPSVGLRATGLLISMLISMLVFGSAFLLVYKIWQGRNWARVTYVVLTAIGMFMTVPTLHSEISKAPVQGYISVSLVVMQLIAVCFLFTLPGKTWFGRSQAPT